MDQHFLTPLFQPRSVVVFAGPPGDPARQTRQARVLRAALAEAPGSSPPLFLHGETTGTLGELARSRADLAVIALPADEIAAALEIAGRIACRSALIVSDGIEPEQAAQLKRIARREGVHLLGPNCLGFQRPHLKLNASAAGPLAAEGSLALVSQSGALTSAMLDWARQNHVGFSQVVSLGPNAAVDLAQVLDFLAADTRTHSIVVYLEGISAPRRFMSALRSAAHAKPVVVLKAGRRSAGNEAALTHSRAIVGSDDVFDAALRRAGAVRVRSFVELFSAAKGLAARNRPVGNRLAIVTNGGGPGVLAADWVDEIGLQLARLSPDAARALLPLLADQASLADLIDLSAAATPEHFRAAVQAAAQDPAVDGLLAVYAPQVGSDATETARAVAAAKADVAGMTKPLLGCWMGDASVQEARRVLNQAAIANFRTPEAAVGAFGNIAAFYANQQLLLQTPPPMSSLAQPDVEAARLLIESVLAERRRTLTEMESKALLAAFHIPVTQTMLARSATEAMMLATQIGFPVALKIDSPDISHKSDVQGVALNIQSGSAARDTFNEMVARVQVLQPQARINGVTVQKMARARRGREVCVGLVTDEALGPAIVFGAGGTMIELIADRAMELPPLNQFLARRLIERARVAALLAQGWQGGPPADLAALEQVLLRVSEMVCEFPQLREMDINPLIVDEHGAVAVDARIVLQPGPQAGGPRAFDYPHLAILPYPARFEQVWPLAGGGEVTVRPVRPDDAQMLQDLVRGLKPESRYFRFASAIKELPPTLLARLTLIDYDREMALVAVYTERTVRDDGGFDEREHIVGVSRIITKPDQTSCEFSLLVADDFGGKGLGSRLMEGITDAAREKGLSDIEGLVLTNNTDMLKLMRGLGFTVKPYPEEPEFRLVTKAL
ncbi:GNAT family N-acetyltransferase [Roseateles sp. BYS78W]|uniref:GNAT family N-acetyltransferase n=1 Tax=Pelomonas candidula TaxID=3299025 RepID=A0ABW7H9T6_9BURK